MQPNMVSRDAPVTAGTFPGFISMRCLANQAKAQASTQFGSKPSLAVE